MGIFSSTVASASNGGFRAAIFIRHLDCLKLNIEKLVNSFKHVSAGWAVLFLLHIYADYFSVVTL